MLSYYDFKFGTLILETEHEIVKRIQVDQEIKEEKNHTPFTDDVYKQICDYLDGSRKSFEFEYVLEGTPFQKRVWEALLDIPYGKTCSYQDIAEKIGKPKASRAVGMANHKNPLLIVVPCHRVISKDGSLNGYAGGIEMKQYLLELEKRKSSM